MDFKVRELERLIQLDPSNLARAAELSACYERLGWRFAGRTVEDWGIRLQHPNYSARSKGLRELGKLGPLAFPVTEKVLLCLTANSPRLRAEAYETVRKIGLCAVPTLVANISSDKTEESQAVVNALDVLVGWKEERRGSWFCMTLRSGSKQYRRSAAQLLGRIHFDQELCMETIRFGLQDADWVLRMRMCEALLRLLPTNNTLPQSILRELIPLLRDESESVRFAALNIVESSPMIFNAAQNEVMGCLADECPRVRDKAFGILRRKLGDYAAREARRSLTP